MYVLENLRRWVADRKGFEWFALFAGGAVLYQGVAWYLIQEGLPVQQAVLNVAFGLEFIGLATVASAMGKLQKHFDEPPWWVSWGQAWLSLRKVFTKPKTITGKVAIGNLSPSVEMGGVVTRSRPDGLENRVERLEQDVDELREDLREAKAELEEDIHELERNIQDVKKHLGRKVREIQREREEAALGSLEIEGAGLTCLILGLLLSAKPAIGVALLRLF